MKMLMDALKTFIYKILFETFIREEKKVID